MNLRAKLAVSARTTIVRSLTRVTTGTLGAQILSLGALPVLSRLYSPTEFAAWAIFVSVNTLITSVATLRYEQSVVLPREESDGVALLLASVVFGTCFSILTAGFLAVGGNALLSFLSVQDKPLWQWLLPATIWFNVGYNLIQAWCMRIGDFKRYATIHLVWAFSTAVVQIGVGLAGYRGSGGLIAGTLAGYALGVIICGPTALSGWKQHVGPHLRQQVRLNLSRYRDYPLFVTPYTLAGSLRDRLIYFLLGEGPIAGYYSLAGRFLNMPNSLAAGILRPLVFRSVAREGFTNLAPVIAAALNLMVSVVLPVWLLFLFYAEHLLVITFGPEWAASALYARILSFPAVTLLFGNWLDRVFDAAGRQRLVFSLEFMFSATAITALVCGLAWSGIVAGIIAQAAVTTIYHLVWLTQVLKITCLPSSVLADLLRRAVWSSLPLLVALCVASLLGKDDLWPWLLALGFLFAAWRAQRPLLDLIHLSSHHTASS